MKELIAQQLAGIDVYLIALTFGAALGAFIVGRLTSFILHHVFERTPFPERIEKGIAHAAQYLVYFIGLLAILGMWGIDITNVVLGLGAFSIAIGFATKEIIQNFVSGIIVMGERPFQIGDRIKIKGEEGIVKKISVRTTFMEADDGSTIIIPNSFILSNTITKRKKAKNEII